MAKSRELGSFMPDEISLVLGSPAPPAPGEAAQLVTIQGWGDGVFLQFRPLNDLISTMQGADGSIGIVLTNSSEFDVDINVKQTAAINGALSRLVQTFTKTGVAIPFYMEDASGSTKAVGGSAVPRKWPDFGFAKEVQVYTWPWYVAHLEPFLGGNAQ